MQLHILPAEAVLLWQERSAWRMPDRCGRVCLGAPVKRLQRVALTGLMLLLCRGRALFSRARLLQELLVRWQQGHRVKWGICKLAEARCLWRRPVAGCRKEPGVPRCPNTVCSRPRLPRLPRLPARSSINTRWLPRKCTAHLFSTLGMDTRRTTTRQLQVVRCHLLMPVFQQDVEWPVVTFSQECLQGRRFLGTMHLVLFPCSTPVWPHNKHMP